MKSNRLVALAVVGLLLFQSVSVFGATMIDPGSYRTISQILQNRDAGITTRAPVTPVAEDISAPSSIIPANTPVVVEEVTPSDIAPTANSENIEMIEDEDYLNDTLSDSSFSGQLSPVVSSVDYCIGLSAKATKYCNDFIKYESVALGEVKKTESGKTVNEWPIGHLSRSYLDMFEATKNTYFLDQFINLNDWVNKKRNDKTVVKGIDNKACWADKTYQTDGKYACWIVHSGFLIYPQLVFADIVKSNPVVLSQYVAKADEYITSSKEVVKNHDGRFFKKNIGNVKNLGSQEGFYLFANNDPYSSSLKGWNLPHNQQLAMASALIVLNKLTGDEEYRDKAVRIGNFFKKDLTSVSKSYVWRYWYQNSKSGKVEDTSHGALDLEYVITARKYSLKNFNGSGMFSDDDMKLFVNTYAKINPSLLTIRDRVDGTGTTGTTGKPSIIGPYLDLNEYDFDKNSSYKNEIYGKISYIIDKTYPSSSKSTTVLRGLAKLCKFTVKLGK